MSTFETPNTEQVRAALRRLTTYQLRRAFYEGLKNPLWVGPLAAAGAFSNPPEPKLASDGTIRELFWPEIGYLKSVAERAPSEVVDVLITLRASTNSWVRRETFSVAARIPAKQAARLKPLIDAWGTDFGWRTDHRDMVSFAVNLLNAGYTKFGTSLASRLFRPRENESAAPEPLIGLRRYWYSEQLPRVVAALGPLALKTVLPWLVEYERLRNAFGTGVDSTGFGRSLVANRTSSYDPIHDALIDAVRDAAIDSLANDPADTWALLNRKPLLIIRRISLYSLARVLAATASRDGDTRELLTIAQELIVDAKCRHSNALIEFVELARTVGSIAPRNLDVLRQVLEEGQYSGTEIERVRRAMRELGADEDEIHADIRQLSENWQHRVLAGIGRDLLPADLEERLDVFDAVYGALSGPISPPFAFTTWSGPNSPIPLEEMATLSPTELVAHLERWHPDNVGIGPEPSHEGQARVLSDLMKSDPLALGSEGQLVDRLRPTYVRAILNGWAAAHRADLGLDWSAVVSLVKDVLGHDDASRFSVEEARFDDDPDFRGAKDAAIGLIVELVKPGSTHTVPSAALAQLADLLIQSAQDDRPWREYSEYESPSGSDMDPLTISLNWQWPQLVRGLISLIAHGQDASWYRAALEALDRELDRRDERGASRAVLGEGLAKLFNQARDWLDGRRDRIFGARDAADQNQQIALTTAVAMHYYHPALYALLSDPMIAALNVGVGVAVGWGQSTSPVERIGQWVIEGVIAGEVPPDDPVLVAFYTVAPPEARGGAIGHIAWSFFRANAVDDAVRDRLAALWDQRVDHVREFPEDCAELKGFYWFVRSEKFEPSWWMPRLRQVVDLDCEFNTHGMVGEPLAQAGRDFPRLALDILAVLLARGDTPDQDGYDLRTNALAPVIAAGLDSHDDQLVADATVLMNRMGERGEIDLEHRVKALREGR